MATDLLNSMEFTDKRINELNGYIIGLIPLISTRDFEKAASANGLLEFWERNKVRLSEKKEG